MTRAPGLLWLGSCALVAVATLLVANGSLTPAQFDLLFAALVGNVVFALLVRAGLQGLRAAGPAVVVAAGAIAAQHADPELRLAPYLAIAVINGLVALVFARGLLPGREPVILQVIRLAGTGPEATGAFRRFAYRQSWLWAGFGLATALCGLVAMVFPGARAAAELAVLASMAGQAVWFVASHRYARRRYGRPETWLGTARAFSRPGLWAALDI